MELLRIGGFEIKAPNRILSMECTIKFKHKGGGGGRDPNCPQLKSAKAALLRCGDVSQGDRGSTVPACIFFYKKHIRLKKK